MGAGTCSAIITHLNVRRHRLQQNQCGFAQQWPHRAQHQHHQQHGQRRVHVVLVLPIGQPHYQCADHHDDAAQCVAQHVQIHAAHVHVAIANAVGAATAMTVPVAAAAAAAVAMPVTSAGRLCFLCSRNGNTLLDGLGQRLLLHERVVLVVVGAVAVIADVADAADDNCAGACAMRIAAADAVDTALAAGRELRQLGVLMRAVGQAVRVPVMLAAMLCWGWWFGLGRLLRCVCTYRTAKSGRLH